MSWYEELAKVLEAALQFKYTQCKEFRNALDRLNVDEIVFADKESLRLWDELQCCSLNNKQQISWTKCIGYPISHSKEGQ